MFKTIIVLFLTHVIHHVEPKNWNRGYSKSKSSGGNPYYGWNNKPARRMDVYGSAKEPNWFHDMGDEWEVSNRLASVNPYYEWYKQAAIQMDMYGPAKHVGIINRGQFLNPELNNPYDRAYGYQSDFNPRDFQSGAFKYKPQGQKFRAKAVHVNEGLASYVGEVRTMPIGQLVQEDGTILVQTPYREDPCHPNPCGSVRMSACTAVNSFTAKCSRSKSYKLTLTWSSPGGENYLNLFLYPRQRDGSICAGFSGNQGEPLLAGKPEDCGAVFSESGVADTGVVGEEYVTLTTLEDGSKYQDHTYVVVVVDDEYNLSESRPVLDVEYGGELKQTLAVPQYRPTGSNVNYDFRGFYFVGCFRPEYGYVDTRGAGYYRYSDVVFEGLSMTSPGLCNALLSWTDGAGYNPYQQSGSGDERYDES